MAEARSKTSIISQRNIYNPPTVGSGGCVVHAVSQSAERPTSLGSSLASVPHRTNCRSSLRHLVQSSWIVFVPDCLSAQKIEEDE